MNALLWALPALIVVVAIASGHLNTTKAALLGLLTAVPVAMLTGPNGLATSGLAEALARGLWIGATIAPYILGGLLFWRGAVLLYNGAVQVRFDPEPVFSSLFLGHSPEQAKR